MPARRRWRPAWIAFAVVLLTLATWSHGTGAVLCVTTVVVYVLVRFFRDRGQCLEDVAVIAASFIATTAGLMIASRFVLGQFDFISPTLKAASYLSQPDQIVRWHSTNWRWAPYVAYLLVPPSVVIAFAIVISRKWRNIELPQLFVGLACAGQLAAFGYLQFSYHVQALEVHFFSSTLWGTVCLTLGIVIAEMARPLWGRRVARWLPAGLVIGIALGYEVYPHVPAFGWWPTGAVLAAVPVLVCALVRLPKRGSLARSTPAAGVGTTVAMVLGIVAVTGSLLVITVAPSPPTPKLAGLAVTIGIPSNYNEALGGSATRAIDWYEISTALPSFVGKPAYTAEQLMMWVPATELGFLLEPVGMYHGGFNLLAPDLPVLSAGDAALLGKRRPAELLLLSTTGTEFETAFVDLGPYQPVLLRTTVMRRGTAVLHAWLIRLGLFSQRA
jgi:hypothetical protein